MSNSPGGQLGAQPGASDESKAIGVGSSEGDRKNEDDGRLELRASDFQLVEETEKDEIKAETSRTSFQSLGIRSFKLLELLRAEAESRSGTDPEGEDRLTTVSYTERLLCEEAKCLLLTI